MVPPSESPPASPPPANSLSTRSGLSNGMRRSAPPPMIARRGRKQAPADLKAKLFGPTGRPVIIGVVVGVVAFAAIRFVLLAR